MLRWSSSLLILGASAALAQSLPGGAVVPVQSLAQVMTEATTEGTNAFVHTHYGTTSGLLLLSGDRVLAARHAVLTPSGDLADEITVGIPQMPLNNVVQVHATPVAQDKTRDLVLLSLPPDQVSPPPSTATKGRKSRLRGGPCESPFAPVADATPGAPPVPRVHTHHAHPAPADPATTVVPETAPALVATPAPALPAIPPPSAPEPAAQPAGKTPMAAAPGVKIVEDGPKPN